jgi:putative cardiolipin synthase
MSLSLFAVGCASLPPAATAPRPPSRTPMPSQETRLGSTFLPRSDAHAGESGFHLISAGVDGLAARIELIDAAQTSLDLQYYIFRADESGNLIVQALLRAAGRGVHIRLIVDDGETVPGDERILSLAAHPGIEVRIFNPLRYRGPSKLLRDAEFLFARSRVDYRMHDKLLVADNVVAIIGGRNIGSQYFQIDPQSQFADDDVVTTGPLVPKLSAVFDEFWNYRLTVPAGVIDPGHASSQALADYEAQLAGQRTRLDALRGDAPANAPRTPFADLMAGRTPLTWAPVDLTYDSPDKKDIVERRRRGRLLYDAVAARARAVDSELIMVTPYFVPTSDELAILHDDRRRGVRIRVLTNSLETAPSLAAEAGYGHYRTGLVQDGVEIHEVRAMPGNTRGTGQSRKISRYGNYGLHGKLYVFDRKTLFIGSWNFDERSKHLNTEIGLLIDSPSLSGDIAARFEALTQPENAYQVTIDAGSRPADPGLVWTTRRNGEIVHDRTEPARSEWQRIAVRLLALLPIDREL